MTTPAEVTEPAPARSFPLRVPTRKSAWKIALAYAVVGAVWILGSGWLLHVCVHDPRLVARIEVFKGWFFVGATALLLGAALDRYFRGLRESAQRLQESEASYRALFDEAADGILLMSTDGSRFQANAAFARMHGYASPQEMDSLRLQDLLTPETAALAPERLRRAAAGEPLSFEVEHVRKDGSTFAMSATVTCVELGGQPCLLSFHRDITERKQAEEAARMNEERLRFALEASHTGAWSVNLQDRTATRSLIHAHLFGYPTAEGDWSMDKFLAHVLPEDLDRVQQQLQAGLVDQSGWRFECRIRRADDQIRWVFIAGGFLQHSPVPQVAGIIQDITERKQAEAALRESEEQLRLLIEHAPASLAMFDRDMRYLAYSRYWLAEYGHGLADLKGRAHYEIYPDLPERWKAAHRRGLAGEVVQMDEDHFEAPDGTVRWGSWSVRPWHRASGEIGGIVIFTENITQRKLAEEALRRSEAQLQEAQAVARVGSWHLDLPADHLTWSAEVCRIFVRTAPPRTYPEFLTLIHPDDRTKLDLAWQATLAGAPYDLEHRILAAGEVRWVHQQAALEHDANGRPIGCLGTVMDITERKLAEVALQESQQLYRSLVDQLGQALFRLDREGRITFVNARYCEQAGRPATELLGKTDFDLFPAALAKKSWADSQRVMTTGEPFETLEQHPGLDGRDRFVRVAKTPLRDAAGAIIGLQCLFWDVTAQHEAERALRESELQFEVAFQHSPAPSMIIAVESRQMREVNLAYCQFTGYSAEELMNHTSAELGLWVDPGAREAMYRRFAAEGHIKELEVVMRTRSGQIRTLLTSAESLHRGGELCLIASGLDITERKQLEADLRRLNADLEQRVAQRTAALSAEIAERQAREVQLQKLWRAVEHSPASVVITDGTAAIEYVNPHFERETGYTAAEVMGKNPRLLQSGTHSPEFYAAMWRTLTTGQTWRGEMLNRRKDGTLFWELAAIAPICDATGRITHYVGIKEDITERRRAAEELRLAKEAADQANQAKSVFLANMSHELRTPMNAVLGFTQLMQRDVTTSATSLERLTTIHRSGEHLLGIINEILDLARIESGRDALKAVPFDLSSLLGDLEAMFSLRAESQLITFTVQRAPGLPSAVVADATRYRQVLINLLGNAFKFTPPGGRITLAVQATPEPDGRVRVTAQVTDSGPGLSAADAARVFEPFFQTSAGQAAGGSGLGLTISRQMARLMGGDLTVSATADGGACFEFVARLALPPAAAAPAAAPAPLVAQLAPASAGYRVLVADDAPENCELLVELLTPLGFSVRTAANGQEAVDVCQTWTPGLVLLDLRMPVMDGREAARRLRAAHGQALKILMVSATVAPEIQQQAQAAGADGFLGKPFDCETLLESVRQLTGVQYLYRAAGPDAVTAPDALTADALRHLPSALLDGLRSALLIGDQDELLALCARVGQSDERLGRQLRWLVEEFNYAALEPLLPPNQPADSSSPSAQQPPGKADPP